MLGINYRYELNPAKGTIKLAPTKKTLAVTAAVTVVYVLGFAGLIGWAEQQERKLNSKLNEDEN